MRRRITRSILARELSGQQISNRLGRPSRFAGQRVDASDEPAQWKPAQRAHSCDKLTAHAVQSVRRQPVSPAALGVCIRLGKDKAASTSCDQAKRFICDPLSAALHLTEVASSVDHRNSLAPHLQLCRLRLQTDCILCGRPVFTTPTKPRGMNCASPLHWHCLVDADGRVVFFFKSFRLQVLDKFFLGGVRSSC